MNLDKAVLAHVEWKGKFRSAITAREQMDSTTIGKDNCCQLGKWLHGDAKAKYGHLAAYKDCLASHANFHSVAGALARQVNGGGFSEVEKSLAASGAFSMASNNTVVAIGKFKAAIAAA